MKRFNVKNRMLIIGGAMLLIIAGMVALFWPSEPSKPTTIPRGDYSYTIEYLDYQVEKMMHKQELPSVCVAMIDDQEIIYASAYGMADIENEVPATLDTVYKMGSITKLFTGIEIMRSVEVGLIDLDAPITDYLPDFSIQPGSYSSEPITVRSLLSHRSGLPRNDSLPGWYWDARPDILKAQTDSLAETYQAFPVGYRYKYSNAGYNVLGRIIEVVREIKPPVEGSAGGWPYYMNEEVLQTLGMNDSSFGSRMLLYGEQPRLAVAMGYHYPDGKPVPVNQFDIIELASGLFQSTMNDMIAFAQYLFNIGETNEIGIIRKETLWSMFKEQYVQNRDPQPQGLTWFTDTRLLGELVVLHTGTNQGFISMIALLPEKKLGFIAFSNGTRFEDLQNELTFKILGLMLETKYGIVPPTNEQVEEVDIGKEILKKYVGTYIIRDETLDITLSGDRLKAEYQGQKIDMIPVGGSKFRLNHWLIDLTDVEIEFFVDDPALEDIMIVYMGDYFICPRYLVVDDIPDAWEKLIGEYELYLRHPSEYSDEDILGTAVIMVEKGMLIMSDGKYLNPISSSQILIVGGIFDGETMIYDEDTGTITWQNLVYMPK